MRSLRPVRRQRLQRGLTAHTDDSFPRCLHFRTDPPRAFLRIRREEDFGLRDAEDDGGLPPRIQPTVTEEIVDNLLECFEEAVDVTRRRGALGQAASAASRRTPNLWNDSKVRASLKWVMPVVPFVFVVCSKGKCSRPESALRCWWVGGRASRCSVEFASCTSVRSQRLGAQLFVVLFLHVSFKVH